MSNEASVRTKKKNVSDLLLEQVQEGERAIIRVLRDYPNISQSMIGIHVRPTVGPVWRELLDSLIEEGVIITYAKERPNGTQYFVYCLADDDTVSWKDEELGESE